jgi:hypothetical protein
VNLTANAVQHCSDRVAGGGAALTVCGCDDVR